MPVFELFKTVMLLPVSDCTTNDVGCFLARRVHGLGQLGQSGAATQSLPVTFCGSLGLVRMSAGTSAFLRAEGCKITTPPPSFVRVVDDSFAAAD